MADPRFEYVGTRWYSILQLYREPAPTYDFTGEMIVRNVRPPSQFSQFFSAQLRYGVRERDRAERAMTMGVSWKEGPNENPRVSYWSIILMRDTYYFIQYMWCSSRASLASFRDELNSCSSFYCVCCHPVYSGRQTCGRTSRGHAEGRSHKISPPSLCGACALNVIARRIQSSLPLVDREVYRFFLCTHELIVLHVPRYRLNLLIDRI